MVKESTRLHLTLKGPGISVDRDVPDALASEVIRLVLQSEGSGVPGSPSTMSQTAPSGIGKSSLAELFRTHEPRRNPDKIAVIAYHLKANGQASFTKEHVRDGFRRAGERAPGNFNRDWTWALTNGWIDGDAANGFYLTNTGEKVVRANFARDLVGQTKLRHGRKRRGKVKKQA